MRMRSKSVLLVLLLLSVAALASHAPIAQNQSQAESASFKNVEETVSRLLLVPVYTASDETLLNDAGDEAARAITRVVSEQEMNSPETGRRILLILHLAFEAPQFHHRPEQQNGDGSNAFARPVGTHGLRTSA